MKRFKLGFLAVLAIAAMSFTVADNTGMFKKFSVDENDCFVPSGSTQGKSSCISTAVNIDVNTCATATASYVGLHLFALDQASFIESGIQTSAACPGGPVFCCFNVVVDNSPLLTCLPNNPNQPTITIGTGTAKRYKVGTIRCKE
jgi:hypothetical protein